MNVITFTAFTLGNHTLTPFFKTFLEPSTVEKLGHFKNNFDAEWIHGISFL